jgi:putative spermidine/putrescine transport system permease protein
MSASAKRFDRVALMAAPAVLLLVALFLAPFANGMKLSFAPKQGDALANYRAFFSDPFLYGTIATTLRLALPVTALNLIVSIPVAMRVRRMRNPRWLTTILVLPITLGVVLIAQGLLTYLGPRGWLNRALKTLGLTAHPVALVHNYWGVFLSLFIAGFPFTFLLTLSHVTGLDPAIEQAAMTLGANARQRFWRVILPLMAPGLATAFCLSFVQAFSVFPSAVLLGAPAGPTRVISIAAYQAAFENYDYSMASTIAMIMGAVQLAVIVAVTALRGLAYSGPTSGGKG